MPSPRPISPYFAGRRAELAQLEEAFATIAESHEGAVYWIAGEAGVGKTRLVSEFAKSLQDRAMCLSGACIPQSESGLPYAPFMGALRQAIALMGAESISQRLGFSCTNALALLLPELGDMPAGEPGIVRARMFEAMRKLLELISAVRPVVLMLEDMHWADAGSRDLLRFLLNDLSGCRVLIIATCRPEQDEGMAMNRLVVDLARSGCGQTLMLQRLSRKEVSDQLEGLLGYLPPGHLVSEVYRRGAGVPLFTEAMIDAQGNLRERLPESIRGLLAGPLDELPADSRALVQAMAVGGIRVSAVVLAQVMGISCEDIGCIARPAIDAKVLIVENGALAFRHSLLRDVAADQILSVDAVRLHEAYANTLANDRVVCPMTWISMALAQHWRWAERPDKSVIAAWSAAQEARARFAYDEQLQMLEIVVELWDEVPDASACLGISHARLLEEATDTACWAAEPAKGLAFVTRALADTSDSQDPDKVVALLLQRAILRQQQLVSGELEDLRRAVSLAIRPDQLRAEALGQTSRALIARGQLSEAKALADELSTLAKTIGSEEFALEASLIRAHLHAISHGDTFDLPTLIQQANQRQLWRLEMIGHLSLLNALATIPRHEEIVRAGLIGIERAEAVGQARYAGPLLSSIVAQSLILLGNWSEADGVIERALDESPAPLGRLLLLQAAGWMACARGDTSATRNILQELRVLDGASQEFKPRAWRRLELEIGLALLEGDNDTAVAEASAIAAYLTGSTSCEALPLLWAGARAMQATGNRQPALDTLVESAKPILRTVGNEHPFARLLRAECLPKGSADALHEWKLAAERFASERYPFHEAYCAYRMGLTVAEGGRRSDAAEAVKRAATLARQLGCEPLLRDITRLAQRARLKMAAPEHAQDGELHELTDRELQVLKLVAMGKRNRDIASELYISPKTASVHVSNILAKLNVRTRSAAAAVAHRLQLGD